ncbi:RING finger protein 207 isoform X4 [Manis javanica]|uniref:RING finger protein 207 isoform X4 n=1 Tax=Manis javanica TaxID=9974 RepID=UPI00187B077A|nr:RING finger protein 207 isoform X4 [Manis javanica]
MPPACPSRAGRPAPRPRAWLLGLQARRTPVRVQAIGGIRRGAEGQCSCAVAEDVGSHLRTPGGPGLPGRGERPPAHMPAVPRAIRAPVPDGLLSRLLCRLPARPRYRRPPRLSSVPTVVKGPSGLPPVDRLLQFLVDSSGDGTEDAETTYFCNTCGQPLCARCRDETHRARMFARHDIVALGQRSRDVLQKCTLHAEPYIMFSTDKKSLLCIRCFRDMQGESRAHCVDLESAYVQGCERLEQAVLAVKALQTATREAIVLLQAMVEEVRRSAAEEEASIHALFSSMQDTLAERKALLLQAVQRALPGSGGVSGPPLGDEAACLFPSQYEEKDKAFKEQLSHLATLLPTLQVHLVICSSFLSLANKAEFLDLGYELMERLHGVVSRPHRLQPAQSSKIASDHCAEFARCLEPLLLLGPHPTAGTGGGANVLAGGSGPKVLVGPSCPSPVGKTVGSPVPKPTLHRSISTKVLLAEGEDTPFTEHCRHYEDSYQLLQAEMQSLKDQVQELHRDLTRHHALIKAEIMGGILHKSLQVDVQIASEYASVEGMRAVFQEIWEESYQRVANEQEIYEAQLRDLLQLKQENAYLTTITKQITPYIRSIAKVKERLEPRFQAPVDEQQSEHLQSMYDSMNEEAQARNDPVSVKEKREKTSEPRANSQTLSTPTEEAPLRNKDSHRPKQKNGGDSPTWREHPT